ncbi:MAG: hypothetical protein G01um101425_857 [Candidatus Peregrinibacteria bacterium Gr01-1014_25]|nr:MAG: hypothetical protein G01um101425_857 [Candidatus Peregrinibacteria bacterium Gr01-1014_25]
MLVSMDLDPHTLHLILQKIRQQMRCPQCGGKVPVEFASVRITGDDFLLFQLRCEACDAYIVLHASLQGATKAAKAPAEDGAHGLNASSMLGAHENEVKLVRKALTQADGSFAMVFGASEAQPDAPRA